MYRLTGSLRLTELCSDHPGMGMSSRLMLSLAPLTMQMVLQDEHCSLPGLSSFLPASNLSELHLSCETVGTAAEAAMLLSIWAHMKVLDLRGTCPPYRLPQNVQELQVTQKIRAKVCTCACVMRLKHAFLCRMTCLPHLQAVDQPFLSSSIQLPALTRLSVSLTLESEVDLTWLQGQRCKELELRLYILSDDPQHHASLISHLRPLSLTRLCLYVTPYDLPQDASHRWTAVSALQTSVVCFGPGENGLISSILSQVVYIRAHPRRWGLNWASLTQQPGRKVVILRPEQVLSVYGCDAPCPGHLQQPWELSVRQQHSLHGSVHGLPPSQCLQGIRLFNAAALALGWDTMPICEPSPEAD